MSLRESETTEAIHTIRYMNTKETTESKKTKQATTPLFIYLF